MIDPLHPDLKGGRGRILIVVVNPAWEEDEGKGNTDVSPELITIDRYGATSHWTSTRLPLVGAIHISCQSLPTAEQVTTLY